MTPIVEPSQKSAGDVAMVVALVAIGMGNLVVPAGWQSLLGIDYVLAAVAVVALGTALRLPRRSRLGLPWLFVLLLMLIMAWGWLQADPNAYGESKLQTFVIATLLILGACSLRNLEASLRLALILSIATALAISLTVVLFGEAAENGRVSVLGLNPVGIARVTGWLPVAGVLVALVGHHRLLLRTAALLSSLVGLQATIITGSRGPIVSAAMALLVAVLALVVARRLRYFWLALLLIVSAIVAPLILGTSGIERIVSGGDSGRSGIYGVALEIARDHPLGVGWGRFGDYAPGLARAGEPAYPHNLFLEMWTEGGVLAVVATIVIVSAALIMQYRSVQRAFSTTNTLVLALFVYALANAQFSSDIVGNRLLWLALAVVVAIRAASLTWRSPAASSTSVVG